ncbi:MAG TPA: CDP-diacylglycerol--serine O-phosphatidyltransferase [Candidatus Limnocylindrales bacterium]|nr:CDP-diacylglycerol--serine O-phosphatidyltransferase [Candidatus Limnocylindrales bacterium]
MLSDLRLPGRTSRRFRRGVYLLPSMFTVANMFCGYACVVYAMRGEFQTAAPFIGFAIILDMLDGLIARLTGTTSAFGLEFDSLADVISFGLAPAVLTFSWGLFHLGRLGWAAGFLFVTAAALRLARFNIQSVASADRRYFVGLPSPAAAGVPAATVYAWPYPLEGFPIAVMALAVVLVPAVLMVSTIRFRSFKTLDFGWHRSYLYLFFIAAVLALVATEPRVILLAAAYGYLVSAPIGLAYSRLRRRSPAAEPPVVEPAPGPTPSTSPD